MTTNDYEPGSLEDLRHFLSLFTPAKDKDSDSVYFENGKHYYDSALHFRDLNREIVEAGTSDSLPEGGLGIRGDNDFWTLAHLPLRFRNLSCEEIAGAIWPDERNLTFLPDSGDFWWTAIHDQNLEVPGEPHELWIYQTYDNGRVEGRRWQTFPTLESAEEAAATRTRSEANEWRVLSWLNGTRNAPYAQGSFTAP